VAAFHVIVTGRVQGVGYRAGCEAEAATLDLDGWVRNRRDGSVEAVFSGDAAEDMVEALWNGPPAALVSNVAVRELTEAVPPGFEVRPTG
jgi:acylphosphatase